MKAKIELSSGRVITVRFVDGNDATFLGERGLKLVGCATIGQAFDRGDGVSRRRAGQQQAREDGPTIEKNGARPALTHIATVLGAGESEVFA